MSTEIIDILIISTILLICIVIILQKIKASLNKPAGSSCNGCSGRTCSVEDEGNCNSSDVSK